jgi:hypothetical protein
MRREVRQPTTKELAEIASGRSVVRRIRRPEKQEVFSETRRSCEGKEKAPALYRGLLKVFGFVCLTRHIQSPPQPPTRSARYLFRLRDRLEPLRVFAVWALPCELGADFASSNALVGRAICYTCYSIRLNKIGAGWLSSLFTELPISHLLNRSRIETRTRAGVPIWSSAGWSRTSLTLTRDQGVALLSLATTRSLRR